VNETRVAIVTGASSGIGRALAERAVRAGWNVFAVGRRAERLAELAERLAPATGELATLTLDLRSPGAAARIASEALARFGRIDVLVNNAGGVAVGPIAQQSDDALYEQMETHTIVPLALTREALPALRASHGQIFYVGSGVARIPVGTLGAYPPAKAAVRNLARIVRNELHDDGIAVTYVDPGAVATEFMTRVGFAGPPPGFAASPHAVARRIFAAFTSRRPVVNAVPWQTFVVAIGEALPGLTDFVLQRAPQIVGGEALPPTPAQPVLATEERKALPAPELRNDGAAALTSERGLELERETTSTFEAALAPLESRMGRLKLQRAFVAGLLVPGSRLELGDVALRWAGMPNKNERSLTHDVLEALTASGFLERSDDDQFTVVRAAGDEPSLPEL
jgi:short-subunit dehydrogenase